MEFFYNYNELLVSSTSNLVLNVPLLPVHEIHTYLTTSSSCSYLYIIFWIVISLLPPDQYHHLTSPFQVFISSLQSPHLTIPNSLLIIALFDTGPLQIHHQLLDPNYFPLQIITSYRAPEHPQLFVHHSPHVYWSSSNPPSPA